MKLTVIEARSPLLIDQLMKVWEESVTATHTFLSELEIKSIKQQVPQALQQIPHLIVAENEKGTPIAFMGIEEATLEMLFVSPEARGKGLGKKLVQYGIQTYSIMEVCVNEQNPQAIGFYEHMGFRVYQRSAVDGQGNPYPILSMRIV